MKIGGHTIEISHPDKLLFPQSGYSKSDLAGYYRDVAEVMLPHLEQRPLTLHRFPDGIQSDGFYQQNASDYFPDWIARVTLPKENGTVVHCVCNDAATLVYLAGQACITPHVWLARADRPHHPDRMVFDLDPGSDDFDTVRVAARTVRGVLQDIGLAAFVMTTGSRGAHVVTPLDASADFDAVREFARRVADVAAARAPAELTTEQRREQRDGRLYLDIMRNAYGQTAVAPYAVRARPGAPVATPLDWDELADGALQSDRYNIGNLMRRLGQKKDPWSAIARHGAGLQAHGNALEDLRRDA